MEFRLLGWVALEEARAARQKAALKSMAGVTDVVRELQQARTDTDVQTAEADPVNDYDRMTLLTKGIASWSYEAPLDAEHIAQLDEDTAKWAATEIVNMHRTTQAEREAGLFRP